MEEGVRTRAQRRLSEINLLSSTPISSPKRKRLASTGTPQKTPRRISESGDSVTSSITNSVKGRQRKTLFTLEEESDPSQTTETSQCSSKRSSQQSTPKNDVTSDRMLQSRKTSAKKTTVAETSDISEMITPSITPKKRTNRHTLSTGKNNKILGTVENVGSSVPVSNLSDYDGNDELVQLSQSQHNTPARSIRTRRTPLKKTPASKNSKAKFEISPHAERNENIIPRRTRRNIKPLLETDVENTLQSTESVTANNGETAPSIEENCDNRGRMSCSNKKKVPPSIIKSNVAKAENEPGPSGLRAGKNRNLLSSSAPETFLAASMESLSFSRKRRSLPATKGKFSGISKNRVQFWSSFSEKLDSLKDELQTSSDNEVDCKKEKESSSPIIKKKRKNLESTSEEKPSTPKRKSSLLIATKSESLEVSAGSDVSSETKKDISDTNTSIVDCKSVVETPKSAGSIMAIKSSRSKTNSPEKKNTPPCSPEYDPLAASSDKQKDRLGDEDTNELMKDKIVVNSVKKISISSSREEKFEIEKIGKSGSDGTTSFVPSSTEADKVKCTSEPYKKRRSKSSCFEDTPESNGSIFVTPAQKSASLDSDKSDSKSNDFGVSESQSHEIDSEEECLSQLSKNWVRKSQNIKQSNTSLVITPSQSFESKNNSFIESEALADVSQEGSCMSRSQKSQQSEVNTTDLLSGVKDIKPGSSSESIDSSPITPGQKNQSVNSDSRCKSKKKKRRFSLDSEFTSPLKISSSFAGGEDANIGSQENSSGATQNFSGLAREETENTPNNTSNNSLGRKLLMSMSASIRNSPEKSENIEKLSLNSKNFIYDDIYITSSMDDKSDEKTSSTTLHDSSSQKETHDSKSLSPIQASQNMKNEHANISRIEEADSDNAVAYFKKGSRGLLDDESVDSLITADHHTSPKKHDSLTPRKYVSQERNGFSQQNGEEQLTYALYAGLSSLEKKLNFTESYNSVINDAFIDNKSGNEDTLDTSGVTSTNDEIVNVADTTDNSVDFKSQGQKIVKNESLILKKPTPKDLKADFLSLSPSAVSQEFDSSQIVSSKKSKKKKILENINDNKNIYNKNGIQKFDTSVFVGITPEFNKTVDRKSANSPIATSEIRSLSSGVNSKKKQHFKNVQNNPVSPQGIDSIQSNKNISEVIPDFESLSLLKKSVLDEHSQASEDSDSDAEQRKAIRKSAEKRIISNLSTSESDSRLGKLVEKKKEEKVEETQEPDSPPEIVSFEKSREEIMESLKRRLESIQKKKKSRRRQRKERFDLLERLREEKLNKLKEKKAMEDDASCSSSEESIQENSCGFIVTPISKERNKNKTEKEVEYIGSTWTVTDKESTSLKLTLQKEAQRNSSVRSPWTVTDYNPRTVSDTQPQQKNEVNKKMRKKKKNTVDVEPVKNVPPIKRLPEDVLQNLPHQVPIKKAHLEYDTVEKKANKKHKTEKLITKKNDIPSRSIRADTDFIPLSCNGPTQFGVVPLDALNYSSMSLAEKAMEFQRRMLSGTDRHRMVPAKSVIHYQQKLKAAKFY